MVSNMENKTVSEVQELLDQIGDSKNAGLVAAAKDPLWLWPVVGVCVAAFVASFEIRSTVATVAAVLLYCFGIAAAVGYAARRRGVQPTFTSWTSELKREFVYYLIGSTVVAATVIGLGFATNFYAAAVVAFFAVSIGGIWYHKRWRNVVNEMVAA